MPEHIGVLVVDHHPVVRIGIRTIFGAEHDMICVGEARDGFEAQRLCEELSPQVVLLGLNLPGPTPLETINCLRERCPQTKVVVFATASDHAVAQSLLTVGVVGYVLKSEAPEALVRSIRTAAEGAYWFSRSVGEVLLGADAQKLDQIKGPELTPQELRVLRQLAKGCDNQQIAAGLSIRERTVRYHLRNIADKLGLSTRGQLMLWAISIGMSEE